MSVLQSHSATHLRQSPHSLKFTISEMKFKQPQPNAPRSHRQPHHHQFYMQPASHQLLHRAMSYKSEKEKRMHRLNQQAPALRLEDNVAQHTLSPMLRTWNTPFTHLLPKNTHTEATQHYDTAPMRIEMTERLSARKKLPTLKYDIEIKRKKSESAKRDIKPSPAELFTRKLQFEGRGKKLDDPQKLAPWKPKTSNGWKMSGVKQRCKEKGVLGKLSGWELQQSAEYSNAAYLLNW